MLSVRLEHESGNLPRTLAQGLKKAPGGEAQRQRSPSGAVESPPVSPLPRQPASLQQGQPPVLQHHLLPEARAARLAEAGQLLGVVVLALLSKRG